MGLLLEWIGVEKHRDEVQLTDLVSSVNEVLSECHLQVTQRRLDQFPTAKS